jgi:hypothetical protein
MLLSERDTLDRQGTLRIRERGRRVAGLEIRVSEVVETPGDGPVTGPEP